MVSVFATITVYVDNFARMVSANLFKKSVKLMISFVKHTDSEPTMELIHVLVLGLLTLA